MSLWKTWLLAARPKTLTAAFIPILVGTALVQAFPFQVLRNTWHLQVGVVFIFTCLSAMFIQIGTNYINDAMDFEKGADTSSRLGPLRVTQGGLLKSSQVWWAGIFCFFLATFFAVPLVFQGGWLLFWIGISAILSGYAYTGGPFPLAYLGLGDVFVLIFFGWVAVFGVYYLNTGIFNGACFLAGTQVGLLATSMIAINHLRDHEEDQRAQKKTLTVRFGCGFVKRELFFLLFIPFLIGFFWFYWSLKWAALLPFLSFLEAFRLYQNLSQIKPGPQYNAFLSQGAFLHLKFGILLSMGLWLR